MDHNILVKLIGFPALLVHGDLLVWDRWRWLERRLPRTLNAETLIDVGCGTGAFTIGAARRGYFSTGLSWNERNQAVALERAALCGVKAKFPCVDVRHLDESADYGGQFDVAICFENIEHVIDDLKLFRDITATLKPGGLLLLTTPSYWYREISESDCGPFSKIENGDHVRRGYTDSMLRELCKVAGMQVDEISSCSGFFSQKITWLLRVLHRWSPTAAWAITLPLRPIPFLLDPLIKRVFRWQDFSICLVAYKPRNFAAS